MDGIYRISLGVMLLISAAGAIGDNNYVDVSVDLEALENSITGAAIVQLCDANSFVLGNENSVWQDSADLANYNSLTGGERDFTCINQISSMTANTIGNSNTEYQGFLLVAGANDRETGNHLTNGNITQMAEQTADVIGSYNQVRQFTGANQLYNSLTLSDSVQISDISTSTSGNDNHLWQLTSPCAYYSNLVDSQLWQQSSLSAEIMGNNNNDNFKGPDQYAGEYAHSNSLVNSTMIQAIYEDQQITGNWNNADQYTFTDALLNSLTASAMIQSAEETVASSGNDNCIDQSIRFYSDYNLATSGMILQESIITTNA